MIESRSADCQLETTRQSKREMGRCCGGQPPWQGIWEQKRRPQITKKSRHQLLWGFWKMKVKERKTEAVCTLSPSPSLTKTGQTSFPTWITLKFPVVSLKWIPPFLKKEFCSLQLDVSWLSQPDKQHIIIIWGHAKQDDWDPEGLRGQTTRRLSLPFFSQWRAMTLPSVQGCYRYQAHDCCTET